MTDETTKQNSDEPTITRDDTLVDKLTHIIAELPELAKLGWNAGQQFNFISVEQMKKEIIPRCAALGILIYPTAIERVVDHRDRINRDTGQVFGMQTEIHLTTTWHITDGKETLDPPAVSIGEALDVQDKAANKASTGAQKNLFKTVFGVTEANEDNDSATPVPRGEQTRRQQPPQAQQKPKRELNDAQKEILGLKDDARKIVEQLAIQYICSNHDVIVTMIQDEKIPAEWEDPKAMKHRDDYRKFIAAAQEYVVVPELDDPADQAAADGPGK